MFYGLNSVAPAVLSWNAHGDANNTILFRSEQYRQPVRRLIDSVEDTEFISVITEIASIHWESDQVEQETRKFVKLLIEEKSKRIRNQLQKELVKAEADGNQQKADEILTELKNFGLDAKKNKN